MADDPTKKDLKDPKDDNVDPNKDPQDDEGDDTTEDEDPDVKQKKEHLANLDVAIEAANEELRTIRDAKKKAADDLEDDDDEPEDDEPIEKKGKPSKDRKIDFNDPAVKEWDKHLDKKVSPVQRELDQEKAEIFQFTLREFLDENPSIARDPKKAKLLVSTYETIKRNSGRTREGILMDLRRAYGAEFLDEAVGARRQDRVNDARRRAIDSDAAITRGASGYRTEREADDSYSAEDRAILARWNLTPEDHQKMKRDQDKKAKAAK